MQMHMAGCTYGDPLQLMKIIHHAGYDLTKRMACIMKNGRLYDDLSAEVIIAHAEFIIASQNSK